MIEQNELVVNYMPFARALASKRNKLTPKSVNYEELESAAFLGLVLAAKKYDPKYNVSFATYARQRIVGEMKDYLIQLKWNGRKEVEMASIDMDVLGKPDGLEDFNLVIDSLSPIGKKVISMYYVEGWSLQEIGESLNCGKSRACQLLKKYREELKSNWEIAA